MSSPRSHLPRPVACALREALEAVASVPVRDAVIARALRDSGLSSIPESGPEVLAFAEGALHRALSDRVGVEIATEVLDQIRPVLERASMRPSRRPLARVGSSPSLATSSSGSTCPAPGSGEAIPEEESGIFSSNRRSPRTVPAPSAPMPIVFFASRDPGAAAALAQALGGRATVRVVEGLLDLLESIDEAADLRRALVLDGARPSIEVRSLVTVAPELAGRANVVVWRAFDVDRDEIANAPVSTEGWARCASDVVAELAEACLRALPET
ncbi:MAG: hypothetical protein M3Y87_30955 [Myxococcota bacterium]|nr:hypothetical protein [Myxococcota bacterium]